MTDEKIEPVANHQLSAPEIFAMIQEAAYFIAEKRGFSPGYEERDWTEAEAEIRARLGLREEPPASPR